MFTVPPLKHKEDTTLSNTESHVETAELETFTIFSDWYIVYN